MLWEAPSRSTLLGLPALLRKEAENGLASSQAALQSHLLILRGPLEQRQAGNDTVDQDFSH